MRGVVVGLVEHDQLGVRDLVRRTTGLIEEVGISGADEDRAWDPPRAKLPGERAFRQCCAPRRLKRGGVVVEPTRPLAVRKADVLERFERLHEGLRSLRLRSREPVGDHAGQRAVGPSVRC